MSKPGAELSRGVDPHHVVRLNRLVNRLIQVAEDDLEVAEAARRAPEVGLPVQRGVVELTPPELTMTDEELAERGWTRSELVIARHALVNKREAPMYLHMAHERIISRQKLMTKANDNPTRARAVVIPVIDVKEGE